MNTCPVVKRIVCSQLQKYYIINHLDRYIATLKDIRYQTSLNMTVEACEEQIQKLWEKRIEFQKFDEIIDGKRCKKINCILQLKL